jgi:hypothetical protein
MKHLFWKNKVREYQMQPAPSTRNHDNKHGKVTFKIDTSEKTSLVVQVPSRLNLETFKLKQMTSGGFLLFVEGEGTLDCDNHGGRV